MSELFKRPTLGPKKELADPSKRWFLRTAVAVAGTALVGLGVKKSLETIPVTESEPPKPEGIAPDRSLAGSEESTTEAINSLYESSDSAYFNADVDSFKPEFEVDMPVIEDRLDVMAELQNNFKLPGIISVRLQHELEALFVGVAIVESRLDTSAVNETTKAFSFLQLLPSVWEEHSREGGSPDSLADVSKVAARLVTQAYNHLTQVRASELEQIKREFFANQTEDYEKYFMTPLIIGAYHAGMGSLDKIVGWFLERFPNRLSTIELGEGANIYTGYDVFFGMSQEARQSAADPNQAVVKNYLGKSVAYVPRAYAARAVFNNYFSVVP